jgi:hypothetical protein
MIQRTNRNRITAGILPGGGQVAFSGLGMEKGWPKRGRDKSQKKERFENLPDKEIASL